ncbi:MAG: thioredoxin family protein [Litorimonas sp.]
MIRFLTIILATICLWISLLMPAAARQSLPVDTGKVTSSLVSTHDMVSPGQSFYVALRTQLDEGWHIYWRNPGDSGEPMQIDWDLPAGVKMGQIDWPLPHRIPTGPIVNYGFEGTPLFPIEFTVPTSAKTGDIVTLSAQFYYLVCKDVCIPENGAAKILIEIGQPVEDALWRTEIETALIAVPRKSGVQGAIRKVDGSLDMRFADLPNGDFSDAYFFPYEQGIVLHSQAQTAQNGADGISLTTGADYLWDEGATPEAVTGVLTYTEDGIYHGVEVDLIANADVNIGLPNAVRTVGGVTFWGAVIGAFFGGLVLNLMPCVFPIISLKALSLSKSAHSERAASRRLAWAYTIGVLATFLLLAIILIILKTTGSQIGWGFQLQSPKVVGLLALLLFVIGLNLLGVFEFGGGLQNTGAALTQKDGWSGSFFTGALAVIVATPCTAPFMAGAVGYALAQSAVIMVAIFMALGFGFALPFLILGYTPALLTKLPKPGPWMERFKELLAFPMFAAAIWLVWVLSLQTGSLGVLIVLTAGLTAALGVWLFKFSVRWVKGLAIAAALLAVYLPLIVSSPQADALQTTKAAQAWSPDAIAQNLSEGRNVFVDFTAAWCVTCKVNEISVLNKKPVQEMFAQTNTVVLIADWTNKDDVIAAELASYGRAGVPLYLVFTPTTGYEKGQVLPQILSYDVIKEALDR